MLKAEEISAEKIKSGIGGYKKKETEEYINTLKSEYEALLKENLELRDKLGVLSEGVQYYKNMEKSLQKALVLAEKTTSETVHAAEVKAVAMEKEAKSRADVLTKEARMRADAYEKEATLKAENLMRDARKKADEAIAAGNEELRRIHSQIMTLVQQYEQYKSQSKQLAAAQLQILESDAYNLDAPILQTVASVLEGTDSMKKDMSHNDNNSHEVVEPIQTSVEPENSEEKKVYVDARGEVVEVHEFREITTADGSFTDDLWEGESSTMATENLNNFNQEADILQQSSQKDIVTEDADVKPDFKSFEDFVADTENEIKTPTSSNSDIVPELKQDSSTYSILNSDLDKDILPENKEEKVISNDETTDTDLFSQLKDSTETEKSKEEEPVLQEATQEQEILSNTTSSFPKETVEAPEEIKVPDIQVEKEYVKSLESEETPIIKKDLAIEETPIIEKDLVIEEIPIVKEDTVVKDSAMNQEQTALSQETTEPDSLEFIGQPVEVETPILDKEPIDVDTPVFIENAMKVETPVFETPSMDKDISETTEPAIETATQKLAETTDESENLTDMSSASQKPEANVEKTDLHENDSEIKTVQEKEVPQHKNSFSAEEMKRIEKMQLERLREQEEKQVELLKSEHLRSFSSTPSAKEQKKEQDPADIFRALHRNDDAEPDVTLQDLKQKQEEENSSVALPKASEDMTSLKEKANKSSMPLNDFLSFEPLDMTKQDKKPSEEKVASESLRMNPVENDFFHQLSEQTDDDFYVTPSAEEGNSLDFEMDNGQSIFASGKGETTKFKSFREFESEL